VGQASDLSSTASANKPTPRGTARFFFLPDESRSSKHATAFWRSVATSLKPRIVPAPITHPDSRRSVPPSRFLDSSTAPPKCSCQCRAQGLKPSRTIGQRGSRAIRHSPPLKASADTEAAEDSSRARAARRRCPASSVGRFDLPGSGASFPSSIRQPCQA
jgi:hypothetical protein